MGWWARISQRGAGGQGASKPSCGELEPRLGAGPILVQDGS